jgi:hypothetical protein
MMNRREMVTAGMLGTLGTTSMPELAQAQAQSQEGEGILRQGFKDLDDNLDEMNRALDQGLRGNSMNFGGVGLVKAEIQRYLKTSGRFPEFCEIGVSIFFDIYDWHVRHQQQILITRGQDQRFVITFMFTQLILRWENAEGYVGPAYER